jgi:hypothetical protein
MRTLSKLTLFSVITIALVLISTAFAQDVVVTPSGDELKALLAALGGLKGAGSLAIVAFAVQALLFFFKSSFAKFSGAWQLIIVNFLTVVGSFIALKSQGMDVLAILTNSQLLAASQVFLHQIFSKFTKDPSKV